MKKLSFMIVVLAYHLNVFAIDTADFFGRIVKIKTLQSQFTQEVSANGRVLDRSSGNMTLKRPDKLFWMSLTDPKQYIVADGKDLYIYDPDLEQVTIKKQSAALESAPASLLTGNRKHIKKMFSVTGEGDHYVLTPKVRDGFKKIEVMFKRGTELPEMMIFVDELGQTTVMRFTNAKLNRSVADSRFKFNIPKGVDVVR